MTISFDQNNDVVLITEDGKKIIHKRYQVQIEEELVTTQSE